MTHQNLYENLAKCAGYKSLKKLEQFARLLAKNKIDYKTYEGFIIFSKKNKPDLRAHALDDRIAIFELLHRNKYIEIGEVE